MELHVSPVMQRAWEQYLDGLAGLRALIYGHEFARTPDAQRKAHYLFHQLQAAAFNQVIGPRHDYPVFYQHTFNQPILYTNGAPNPDCVFRIAFVDGARTYRIWGRRSNSLMVLIQAMNRYFGDGEPIEVLGTSDLDHIERDPDGSFEIVASAQRHPGNWIPLDPASPNNALLVREMFYNWDTEMPGELHIEAIDDAAPRSLVLDEHEFAHRLERAVRLMRHRAYDIGFQCAETAYAHAGWNNFYTQQHLDANKGVNPAALFYQLVYDIGPDEALIVESDLPNPRYWNMNLTDIWTNGIDFAYHQSSLNGHQAVVDGDGKVRVVISVRDPGIPNWLDPVDSLQGTLVFRCYFAERPPNASARVVHFPTVRDQLPKETPTITPEERARQLSKRRVAVLRRYGY
jgi:hypothetical protein